MNTSIADEVLEQLKGMPQELQRRVLISRVPWLSLLLAVLPADNFCALPVRHH